MFCWEKIAEERIREALNKGEFDNLPGSGKPVDLSAYFSLPPHLRMAYDILKRANVLPPEAEILREVHSLEEEYSTCASPDKCIKIREKLNQKEMELNILLERNCLNRSRD